METLDNFQASELAVITFIFQILYKFLSWQTLNQNCIREGILGNVVSSLNTRAGDDGGGYACSGGDDSNGSGGSGYGCCGGDGGGDNVVAGGDDSSNGCGGDGGGNNGRDDGDGGGGKLTINNLAQYAKCPIPDHFFRDELKTSLYNF